MLPSRSMVFARARAAARTGAFVSWTAGTVAAFELQAPLVTPADRRRLLDAYRRNYFATAMRLFGVRSQVSPLPPPPSKARLVIANHRSVLDIPVIVACLGGGVLSRHDVAEWPLLGRLARHGGTIFVDRGNHGSGAAAIRAIRRRLAAGETVVVFPEGGTSRGDEVRPFRAGVFSAARGLDVEILPIGIAHEPGTEYVNVSFVEHLAQIALRRSTRVEAVVGAPMSVEGSTAELAARARSVVQSLVDEARRRFEAGGGDGS